MASKPKRSQSSILLEQRQLKELEKLDAQTAQRKLASARRTRGRASLISGSEAGIDGDPDFGQKNLATKERIGVAAKAETARLAQVEADFEASISDMDFIQRGVARRSRKAGLPT